MTENRANPLKEGKLYTTKEIRAILHIGASHLTKFVKEGFFGNEVVRLQTNVPGRGHLRFTSNAVVEFWRRMALDGTDRPWHIVEIHPGVLLVSDGWYLHENKVFSFTQETHTHFTADKVIILKSEEGTKTHVFTGAVFQEKKYTDEADDKGNAFMVDAHAQTVDSQLQLAI